MDGFLRPDPVVLPDDALVPPRHLISPAPNQFTHELTRPQAFSFDAGGATPAGELPAGTKVVLLVHDGGRDCRVVDGRGLYVRVAYDALRALGGASRAPDE